MNGNRDAGKDGKHEPSAAGRLAKEIAATLVLGKTIAPLI